MAPSAQVNTSEPGFGAFRFPLQGFRLDFIWLGFGLALAWLWLGLALAGFCLLLPGFWVDLGWIFTFSFAFTWILTDL